MWRTFVVCLLPVALNGGCKKACVKASEVTPDTFRDVQFFVVATCGDGMVCDFSRSSQVEVSLSADEGKCFDAAGPIKATLNGRKAAISGGTAHEIVQVTQGDRYCACDPLDVSWSESAADFPADQGIETTLSTGNELTVSLPATLQPGRVTLDSWPSGAAWASSARFALHWEPAEAAAPDVIFETCELSANPTGTCGDYGPLERKDTGPGEATYGFRSGGEPKGNYAIRLEWRDEREAPCDNGATCHLLASLSKRVVVEFQ